MSQLIFSVEENNFQSLVMESRIPVLIDFWADHCSPCVALTPILEQIAAERSGQIKICKVNVDTSPELAARFNIRALPFFVLIKNGQKVSELIGSQGKKAILKAIDALPTT